MASTAFVAASQQTTMINSCLSSFSHSRRLLQSQPSVSFLPSRSRASVITPPTAIAAPRASLAAVPPPNPRVSLFSKTSASPLLPSREPLLSRRPADSVRASAAAGAAAFGDGARAFDDSLPFPPPTQTSVLNRFRAILFYLVTLIIATPLFVLMLVVQPFVLLLDRTKRRAQHVINNVWANTTTAVFYPTEVVGVENLPPPDAPAVYVANHQSFLDIYTLFQLRRPFKFISKTSNFLIPIVGWSMFLTGHVPLKRMDKRSQMECLKKCLELLQQGTPVLFFPEGTRTKDGKLSDFKAFTGFLLCVCPPRPMHSYFPSPLFFNSSPPLTSQTHPPHLPPTPSPSHSSFPAPHLPAPLQKGAFSIAAKAGVPVVPITLIGTGALMPSGLESTLAATSTLPPLPPLAALPAPADSSTSSTASLATKSGSLGTKGGVVRVVVHPPITGTDADKLCEQSRAVIASTLRQHGLGGMQVGGRAEHRKETALIHRQERALTHKEKRALTIRKERTLIHKKKSTDSQEGEGAAHRKERALLTGRRGRCSQEGEGAAHRKERALLTGRRGRCSQEGEGAAHRKERALLTGRRGRCSQERGRCSQEGEGAAHRKERALLTGRRGRCSQERGRCSQEGEGAAHRREGAAHRRDWELRGRILKEMRGNHSQEGRTIDEHERGGVDPQEREGFDSQEQKEMISLTRMAPPCSRLANSLLALALSPFLPSLPTDQLCVCALQVEGRGRGQHRHSLTPLPGGRAGTRGEGREAALPVAATRESIEVPVCGDGRGAALPVAATRESNMALCMAVVGRGKRHGVKGRVGRRWEAWEQVGRSLSQGQHPLGMCLAGRGVVGGICAARHSVLK
ncbi:unnamed protein product [Closterium sp. NIES-64]|nr:unnamed protein product [Closterium sp. NIES-64]